MSESSKYAYSKWMKFFLVFWLALMALGLGVGVVIASIGDGWVVQATGVAVALIMAMNIRDVLRLWPLVRQTYIVSPNGLLCVDSSGSSETIPWEEIAEIRGHILTILFELVDSAGRVRLRAYDGRGGPEGLISACVQWTGRGVRRRILP